MDLMSINHFKAVKLKEEIENSCIKYGLNLAIYDNKIAFVDQEEKKIIALWNAEYTLN